jgi:hypothetical protein
MLTLFLMLAPHAPPPSLFATSTSRQASPYNRDLKVDTKNTLNRTAMQRHRLLAITK